MRIVRPDDNLGASETPLEMRREGVERLGHMPVPQIPRIHSPLKHSPVIFFCVSYEPGILFRREEIVLGDLSVPMKILIGTLLQISELPNHLFLAGLRKAETGGVTVSLLVPAKMIETRVAITSSLRAAGIDLFQIPDHFLARTVQTIQVESVETYLNCISRPGVIVLAKPTDECFHIAVAPHPHRESREGRKRLRRCCVSTPVTDIAIDPVRIGPIRFCRNGLKPFLFDQPLSDCGSR